MEPGLLRLRRRRLHDEADHAPVSPSGGQHQAARLLLRGLLHSQTADLGGRRTLAATTGRRVGGGDGRGLRLTLMLFLKVYPGRGRPFFLSMGSLKMTSCSKRNTLLSLALDGTALSCSLTKKVSCWSSFPCAVILPWGRKEFP